jgi:hypothetical protein
MLYSLGSKIIIIIIICFIAVRKHRAEYISQVIFYLSTNEHRINFVICF